MQKREQQSNLLNIFKRPRSDSLSNSPQKKLPERPPVTEKPLSPNFRSSILQNGDAKAYWYFDNIKYNIDNDKDMFFESPKFITGNGDKWNILLWPCKTLTSVGVFLQLVVNEGNLAYSKTATAYFEAYFTIESKLERKITLSLNHKFDFAYRDSGFENFVKHIEFLAYLDKPFVVEITVSPAKPHEDSKELIGYNGIVNEGTTCYMNSLLQTLYFLNCFRKAVYAMPTTLKDQDRLPLALQMIFYHLQFCNTPASTRELLTSFGWNSDQWNIQHDVQELNCILSDHLENKMKNTPAEGTYSKLFVGKMESFIKCQNVNYTSSRTENFTDIQLNVEGCDNIYKSFEKYIEVESLIGDNKYEAEGFGKQDAEKGVMFLDLPPVLQLQLKRFEYDSYLDKMIKLNHKYDFFEEINLGAYVKTPGKWKYSLFSILVHKGNAVTGHYFSYISPKLNGEWYIFNDDSVDRVLFSFAKMSSLGGDLIEYEVRESGFVEEVQTKNETCAYMLVYIKTDMKSMILEDLAGEDIPEHVKEIFDSENKRRKEELKQKALKDSLLTVYVLSSEILLGWAFPGISGYDNDLYGYEKFTYDCGSRAKLEIKKGLKGRDLENEIKKHVSGPVKLWTFVPGYKNWQFKRLILNDTLFKQVKDRAVYIETEKSIFETVDGEWRFCEDVTKTPSSQGTEGFEDEPSGADKVFLVFKLYEWTNGPSVKIIKSGSISQCPDIEALRKEVFKFKHNSQEEYNGKIRLYIEKSTENPMNPHELNISIIESSENFELHFSTKSPHNAIGKVRLMNGDIIICEEILENIPLDYITAKEYLTNLYQNIYVNISYYNKYLKFGFESFSVQVLNTMPESYILKLTLKLQDSINEVKTQVAKALSGNFNIEPDQILLFYTENPHSNYIQIPCTEGITYNKKPCKTVSDMMKFTNSLFYDVLPFPMKLTERNYLVFISHVNEKFSLIKQYFKLVEKNELTLETMLSEHFYNDFKDNMCDVNLNYLENQDSPLLKTDPIPPINGCSSDSLVFYLLNHPQNAIIRELSLNDPLESYLDNPNYLLCFRVLSAYELSLSKSQSKMFIFTYTKGSDRYSSEVGYFELDISCKMIISSLSQRYEEKIRVMIFMPSYFNDRIEYKPSRPLEESDDKFFDKYAENPIGIELPCSYVYKNELKIKDSNNFD